MTDFVTARDEVPIAYERVGEGPPVVLVHGFGSDRVQNWRATGWYDTLVGAGHCVIALDCRGHGESGKPHVVSAYEEAIMAADVAAVIRATDASPALVMGYSMGGAITLRLAHDHPDLVQDFVLGGVGESYFTRTQGWRDRIADAVIATNPAMLNPVQRMFHDFAHQSGKDPLALAACMRAPRDNLSRAQLGHIAHPALIVCGEADDVSGSARPLSAALLKAEAVVIPKRDHMRTVGDRQYKEAVLRFLADRTR